MDELGKQNCERAEQKAIFRSREGQSQLTFMPSQEEIRAGCAPHPEGMCKLRKLTRLGAELRALGGRQHSLEMEGIFLSKH